MTRIVQIVPFLAPGTGIGAVAWNLDRAFRALGVQVENFTYGTALRGRSPRVGLGRRRERMLQAWRVVWFSTIGGRRARAFLGERPDAVGICHNNAMAGDVYVNHGVVLSFARARRRALRRVLRNPLIVFTHLRDLIRYRGSTHRVVVALTHAEADVLRHTYGRIRPRIEVIPNGVDLEAFRPPSTSERREVRELFRLDPQARVALFIGHDLERKGLGLCVEALREAPTVLLLAVGGDAKAVAAARRHAEERGVADRMLLLGDQTELSRYFAVADMFVMPSAYEASGLVYLEALASGLPVIATRVGVAVEVIREGHNGFLVDAEPRQIAARLEQLAAEDLSPWRERARRSVAEYSWTAIARRYLDLAERVQAERKAQDA
jgi:glycosyltransferase involved in cell wall biosynthesis